ncbi:hypothetical protein LG198_01135 [Methylobacillus arboreus]|uniref:hypothetical protein n=1 Tax=Methylobacillus arboreus TaxID=755170 RepID=UPI001E378FD1|nr:hypothetical protein [Methylobacillus arboreus]MCB5189332.1 hypothetical protein [Methylobacillus arboreus]
MLPRSFNWPPSGWELPWRDELRILIQPHKLSLLRVKRGIRHQPVAKEDILLETSGASLPSSEFWQPAISSLHQQLQTRQWHGCQPRVVVSNHFAHYAIVPWNTALSNRQEQNAFVRHCFTQAYGDFARGWDIRTTPVPYGHPALASAIDDKLLQALREEFRLAGMSVRHINPHLMVAINVVRHRLARTPLLNSLNLVMLENDRLIVSLFHQGQWLSLQSYAAESDIEDQLQALLERESIIAGIDTSQWPVIFYATETLEELNLPGRKVYNILPHAQHHHGLEAWH